SPFHHPATTAISTLSLHDALPIFGDLLEQAQRTLRLEDALFGKQTLQVGALDQAHGDVELPGDLARVVDRDDRRVVERRREPRRSEEHTSELQSLAYLVCRLLLEK